METERKNDFAVDSRDVKLHYLYNTVLHDPSQENQEALKAELAHRLQIDTLFNDAAGPFMEDIKKGEAVTVPQDFDCYRELIDNFERSCGMADAYTFKYFKVFAAQCEAAKHYPPAKDGFKTQMKETCEKAGLTPVSVPELENEFEEEL